MEILLKAFTVLQMAENELLRVTNLKYVIQAFRIIDILQVEQQYQVRILQRISNVLEIDN